MRNPFKALLVCLALASCGSKNMPPPDLPPVPGPQLLPDRALTDQDIEVYWGRDRANLAMCVARTTEPKPVKGTSHAR